MAAAASSLLSFSFFFSSRSTFRRRSSLSLLRLRLRLLSPFHPSLQTPFLATPIRLLCCSSRANPLRMSHGRTSAAIPISSGFTNGTFDGNYDHSGLVVVSFYRFADLPDHAEFRKPLKELCEELRVSGGIILAPEGVNGSICGTRDSVVKVLRFIQSDERLNGLRMIESPVTAEDEAIHGHSSESPLGAGDDAPFRWDHVRVKLKKEIVTFGDPNVMPTKMVGKYVKPKDWNELISDPETVVIDVRNNYETRIGKFRHAVDPRTGAFREFPDWVDEKFNTSQSDGQDSSDSDNVDRSKLPRVAMYCTGGIRCEKASSFLLSKGFKEVYHLEGGILKYLEEIPRTESLWEGECFVFDKRVSVEHGLAPTGSYKLCYGCKQPVSETDMASEKWEFGVSCPYCYEGKSEEERERARARQRQVETWGVVGGPDKGRPRKNVRGEEKGRRKLVRHGENGKVLRNSV